MDIFIINKFPEENLSADTLKQFMHKNFSNKKKLYEHCFTYYILDKILKEKFHIEKTDLFFENNKPYLKDKKKFFSLSHTQDYITICFSDGECGIDIEKIVPRKYENIAQRMKFEVKNLDDFYMQWTLYEAKYKLGTNAKSIKQIAYKKNAITALSSINEEVFNIYIHNGKSFSNLEC